MKEIFDQCETGLERALVVLGMCVPVLLVIGMLML